MVVCPSIRDPFFLFFDSQTCDFSKKGKNGEGQLRVEVHTKHSDFAIEQAYKDSFEIVGTRESDSALDSYEHQPLGISWEPFLGRLEPNILHVAVL